MKVANLPVIRIWQEGFLHFRHHGGPIALWCLPPFVLTVVLCFLGNIWTSLSEGSKVGIAFLSLFTVGVLVIAWAPTAVAIHRSAAQPPQSGNPIGWSLDRRAWSYIGAEFKIGLLLVAVIILIAVPTILVVGSAARKHVPALALAIDLVLTLVVTFFSVRLGLALAAVALGDTYGVRQCWRLSRGNAIRLYVATAVPPAIVGFCVGLPLVPFQFVLLHSSGLLGLLVQAFFQAAAVTAAAVSGIVPLTLSYLHIRAWYLGQPLYSAGTAAPAAPRRPT